MDDKEKGLYYIPRNIIFHTYNAPQGVKIACQVENFHFSGSNLCYNLQPDLISHSLLQMYDLPMENS